MVDIRQFGVKTTWILSTMVDIICSNFVALIVYLFIFNIKVEPIRIVSLNQLESNEKYFVF